MKTKIQNLFIALAWLALPALVQAQFTFTTNNGAITIIGYDTAAGLDAVIPAMTNGYPVTSIGDFAFLDCTSLTNVTIPQSVTSIGSGAFETCSSLPSVTIPNSVTNIGQYAFAYCTSLTSVTIPSRVTSIGNNAFVGSGITSVTIPASVTSIGDFAFEGCTSLTSIAVDASNPAYSSMNGVLFDKAQATLLQFPGGLSGSYTISNSVTSIGFYAFEGSGITNVTIPNSVTSIGNYAFEGCTSLASVTIPNSVTNIGNFAFRGCTSLTSVALPNRVTNIGFQAFSSCTSLTGVTIPNSVTSIGSGAFLFCTSLTSVTIPNSVTNIGNLAFGNCANLTSAYFLGNAPPDSGNAFLNDPATVYYLAGTTGWGSTFGGVPAVLWNPQANSFSRSGGQYGFNLTGPTNAVIVVEACTNLSHPVWLPVSTNTLSGLGTSAFSDPTGYPMRYYRFRSP